MIVADWTAALKGNGEFIKSWTRSTPSGQSYGNNGHVPCDHAQVFEYEHAIVVLSYPEHGSHAQLERTSKSADPTDMTSA